MLHLALTSLLAIGLQAPASALPAQTAPARATEVATGEPIIEVKPQTPKAQQPPASEQNDSNTDTDTDTHTAANTMPANCVRFTGSRVRTKARRAQTDGLPPCRDQTFGRSYGREDIDRTGAFDIADALRRLDPAFW